MSQQLTDSEAFDLVTSGFYRSPEPLLAEAATRHFLANLAHCPEDRISGLASLLYLFGRVMQVSPAARASCESILGTYTGPHAPFAAKIRSAHDDPSFPNALQMSISGPVVLDLLWADFFVTGSLEPLLRILAVLDGPDLVRRRLDAWLGERPLFGGAKRRAAAAVLASRGVTLDLDARSIRTPGDLDCLCYSIAEQKHPIFRELPFSLAEAEVLSLAIKGSALWSLRLNSTSHPRVAEFCRSQASEPGGPARRLLLEPMAPAAPFRL